MKTAQELGLNDKQFQGLHNTLTALKAGTIVHIDDEDSVPQEAVGEDRLYFNMDVWQNRASYYKEGSNISKDCGSVCCIGGTAEFLMKDNDLFGSGMGDESHSQALHLLFYPWDDERYEDMANVNGSKISMEEAIQALTSYLEAGDANWPAYHTPLNTVEYRNG